MQQVLARWGFLQVEQWLWRFRDSSCCVGERERENIYWWEQLTGSRCGNWTWRLRLQYAGCALRTPEGWGQSKRLECLRGLIWSAHLWDELGKSNNPPFCAIELPVRFESKTSRARGVGSTWTVYTMKWQLTCFHSIELRFDSRLHSVI